MGQKLLNDQFKEASKDTRYLNEEIHILEKDSRRFWKRKIKRIN